MNFEKIYEEMQIEDVKNTQTKRAFKIAFPPANLTTTELFQLRKYMAEEHKLIYLSKYNGFKVEELEYMKTEVKEKPSEEDMVAAFLAKKNNKVTDLGNSSDYVPEERQNKTSANFKSKKAHLYDSLEYEAKFHDTKFISSTHKYVIDIQFKERLVGTKKGSLKGVPQTFYTVTKTDILTGKVLKPVTSKQSNLEQGFKDSKFIPYNEENLQISKDKLTKTSKSRVKK